MKSHQRIALLTDFGTADGYVASMKAAILSIAPAVSIVDITHDVPPQDIRHGGYVLWSCYRVFPQGTIFACVVDPGVGTARKICCVHTGGYFFIVPDNGILQYVLAMEPVSRAVHITHKKYFAANISTTFHGRDIFAPVAAHLANGVSMKQLGPAFVMRRDQRKFVHVGFGRTKTFNGEVLHIDRYGNVITNFLLERPVPSMRIRIGKHRVTMQSLTYAAVRRRTPFLVVGSNHLLEISINNGNAAGSLHTRSGQPIQLSLGT